MDHHRPVVDYARVFARAGLAIRATWETPGLDLETFKPSSDFMVFDLTPTHGEGS